MTRPSKRRIKKVGLPTGTLVYTGEKTGGKVDITLIDYNEQSFEERIVHTAEECQPYRDRPTATWINVDGVHDASVLERLEDCFGIHRLVTEDLMSVVQRPKVEDYGNYLFVVLKMLTYDESTGKVVPEQVSLVLGRNFLLSFQEGIRGDAFTPVRERLRTSRGRIRTAGVDYLAYSLLDAVVDGYFLVLEKVGDRIDRLEDAVITDPGSATVETLYRAKRELLFLQRAVWPLREVVASLTRRDSAFIDASTTPYLRDVYDHISQVIDSIEIYREMLTELLGTHLSAVSNRLNQIMKVLTVIATIFMPLTFIAGVYGMNFRHMPELDWTYGYLFIWLIMLGIGVGMFLFFRRKRWMD